MAWPVSSAAAYFNPRTPVGCDTGVERILFEHGEFQSTHPSGVRRGSQGAVIQYWDISIHAPQWGATTSSALLTSGEQFQSTHPSGVRRYSESTSIFHLRFQSTHPSGVRPLAQKSVRMLSVFQSTHPSGVRLYRAMLRKTVDMISIHAPQWGATPPFVVLREPQGYFNPRTPVGCDQRPSRSWRFRRNFNPRTPVGCDSPSTSQSTSPTAFQSTHPSGVRHNAIFNICEYATRRSSASTRYFNPRTPVGCDRIGWSATYQGVVTFKSTHPSGVRRHDSVISSFHLYFNPRTPVGCDTGQQQLPRVRRISIHAPQWGATSSVAAEGKIV